MYVCTYLHKRLRGSDWITYATCLSLVRSFFILSWSFFNSFFDLFHVYRHLFVIPYYHLCVSVSYFYFIYSYLCYHILQAYYYIFYIIIIIYEISLSYFILISCLTLWIYHWMAHYTILHFIIQICTHRNKHIRVHTYGIIQMQAHTCIRTKITLPKYIINHTHMHEQPASQPRRQAQEYAHTRTHSHMHTYAHIYTHTHTHSLTHKCTNAHIHLYTQTHSHTHTHTHTHGWKNASQCWHSLTLITCSCFTLSFSISIIFDKAVAASSSFSWFFWLLVQSQLPSWIHFNSIELN